MRRKQRFVHLISILAVMVGLFSPLLTMPATAQNPPLSDPETVVAPDEGQVPLTSESDEPEGEGSGTGEESPPSAPALIAVSPAAPILVDAVCGEGAVYAQTAEAPVTEGVVYTLGEPDAAGSFLITATLADASIYTWADTGLDGWTVSGDTATSIGNLALCPPPAPPAEPQAQTQDEPEDGEQATGSGRARRRVAV